MNRLFVYLKDYKKETILGPLFKLLEASFELFVPLVVASMIDVGIKTGDTGYIIRMCLVLVALGVIGLVCSITAQYFAAKAAVGFVKKIRHALFRHIQSLSYTELDTLGASTMITRMTSDVNQVQNGTNLTLRLLLRSPFVVFGAMIMAFTIDWQAALVFVATIPLLCIVVFGIMLVSIPLYRKVQSRLDRLLGITRENLTGVRVLRAFCKENEEIAEFETRNEDLTGVQKFVGRISALMNPVTYLIINFAVIALIWTGALRVESGILTQGMVVALYNYMSQILVELIKMANLIINITKAVACGNRIAAVFDITSSQEQSSASPETKKDAPLVEFRDVALQYKNAGEDSLSGLSFTAAAGETIGVIGGTGSGKSSLVGLIPRFYDATQGAVLVQGADVRDYPLDELRGMIGVVPQKAVLFQGTVRDNMKWGNPDATDDEIWDALASAQAQEVVESKEGGLDFVIEQAGRNLSGGQRQRLTIARALVRRPRILILDDSSSALDFATDAALRKAIRELPYSPTVFLVSQRASSIQYADRIIVLDDGCPVGIGTHEELLESCGVYREIYNSQFRKEDA
ncbi:ABC transporter ATP-binding protein [Anaeromassilibacillus sp. An200]|uniref:ABC transporter ATP-binding protein n=1 Tax=Candidatus Caccousia stercoris TaxID=2840723 RepID=A0A9D1FRM6_9FIRM|nr:ABC transporter ATP-binding protein [Anaeromassilibacillus sp. An200]OUP12342.1 ATP-binding protein [Anaeromassilibacillus sp. An200]HIS78000.1 ABC transporter ATP-binding protein [Candidatus Caccousia stercoris]